jgi:hypothetical protein
VDFLHESQVSLRPYISYWNGVQWLSEIIPLFLGQLDDRPEKKMPETDLSTRGRVEAEAFVWQRVIVFLIEVIFDIMSGPKYWNFLAQVMCELKCLYFTFLN